MVSSARLSIIIASYNTKDLTIQAVQSVLDDQKDAEVILVDNASTDGSQEALKKTFGNKIYLRQRQDNGGFAKANNEGIQIAKGKYILLLNSDTIVRSGALETLVKAMEENTEFGILSSKLLNPDGSYQPQGGALPSLFAIWAWWLWPLPGQFPLVEPYQNMNPISNSVEVLEQGWVGGTAMLIRKEVIDQIGFLDENIFMYAEDVDYCLRARQRGWKIGMVQSSMVTHFGSASTSHHNAMLGEVKGLLYLWTKHFPAWQRPVLQLLILAGAILRYLLFGILKGNDGDKKLYRSIVALCFR